MSWHYGGEAAFTHAFIYNILGLFSWTISVLPLRSAKEEGLIFPNLNDAATITMR
jgi:hypothetical protein